MQDRPDRERSISIEISGPGKNAKRIRFAPVWAWIVGVLLVAFLAAGFLAVVQYVRVMRGGGRYTSLLAEVDTLRAENQKLRQLEAELQELRELQEQMLHLAGIEPALGVDESWRNDLPALSSADSSGSGDPSTSMRLHPAPGMETSENQGLPPLRWPLSGERRRGFSAAHPGVDIEAFPKQTVIAAGDGIVIEEGKDPKLGNRIVLQHRGSLRTVYANNALDFVAVGDTVAAGEVIALVGSGPEGGVPHLHFEVWNGKRAAAPDDFMRAFVSNDGR